MTVANANPQATLFDRLGGTPGVEGIVDDIVAAHMENPAIRSRFLPYRESPEKLQTVKRHLCEFITAGTGGPGDYSGQSMPDAHRGMNISEREYMAAVDDILMVLDKHRVDHMSRQEILAIAYSLKDDIMHL